MSGQPPTRWSRTVFTRAGTTGVEYARSDDHADVQSDPIVGLRPIGEPLDLGDVAKILAWPVPVETGTKWLIRVIFQSSQWRRFLLSDGEMRQLAEALRQRAVPLPDDRGELPVSAWNALSNADHSATFGQ